MAGKVFIVEGRSFRTESDYALAKRDKETIDRLRGRTNLQDKAELEILRKELRGKKYHFHTLLGQDFLEEVEDLLKKAELSEEDGRQKRKKTRLLGRDDKKRGDSRRNVRRGDSTSAAASGSARGRKTSAPSGSTVGKREAAPSGSAVGKKALTAPSGSAVGRMASASADGSADGKTDADMEAIVQAELKKREKRRRLTIILCSVLGVCCLGYFSVYSYYTYRTNKTYQQLSELKEKPLIAGSASGGTSGPLYTLDDEAGEKEVLDEYKNLLLANRKLIGWVKIEGTYIDYPVMQTTDNEYYLDHNLNQEYDKNGTIFMDKDCDVLKPSTNYILYGHHMKNGRMFGQLDLYQKESYYKEHPYISFDTIYEKGTYQVMYVFRSKVYKETEIVFKYYQFIDANSEQEFDSYMQEMADMSFYDTGVTAEYGDQLLTLSTCDYRETDGRFVVVAKKVEE